MELILSLQSTENYKVKAYGRKTTLHYGLEEVMHKCIIKMITFPLDHLSN